MNREQRLANHQQEVDPYLPDLRRLFEATIPAGTKLVIVGTGTFAALLIRDEEVALIDGYGSGQSDGGSSSEVSRPTERAALQLTDPDLQPVFDYVHRNVEGARKNLRTAADAARLAISYMAEANRMASKHEGRQADRHIGSGDCQACDRPCSGARNDRLMSSYCPACYRRWLRNERPDRAYFERQTPAWDAPTEEAS